MADVDCRVCIAANELVLHSKHGAKAVIVPLQALPETDRRSFYTAALESVQLLFYAKRLVLYEAMCPRICRNATLSEHKGIRASLRVGY